MSHVDLALLDYETKELTVGPPSRTLEGVDRLIVESEHVDMLNTSGSAVLVDLSMAAPLRIEFRGDEKVAVLGDKK